MKNQKRVRRDYTQGSLTTIKEYTRTRNGKTHIVKKTVRGLEVEFSCKECGKTFIKNGNRVNAKFCSRGCYKKDWIKRIAGWNKGKKGVQVAWNRGLNKENSASVKKYSESMQKTVSEQFKNGERKVNGYRKWKDTDIEIILQKALTEKGIDFKPNYPINLEKFTTFPDMYIKEYKLCVYADGEYWHNYPNGNNRDRLTDETLLKNGYKVARFWGRDIKKNTSQCISSIESKMKI